MKGLVTVNARRIAQTAERTAQILALLAEGDRTVQELADLLGMGRGAIDNQVNRHLKGLIHIARWSSPGVYAAAKLTAVWRLGPGERARRADFVRALPPKPPSPPKPPETKAEPPDPEAWFDQHARALAAATQPFRDRHPLSVAMFGGAP